MIEEPPEEEVLGADDITVQNTLRMLQMDGSFDNILDRSSCNSVLLPVNAIVNNQELTISTTEDFDLIEEVFEMSDEDDDTLYLVFPVTLIFQDYSSRQVLDSDEFLSITNACSNGVDEDIECIDFSYPIEVSTYNRNTQVAEVLEFTEDRELYLYLDQLSSDLVTGFRYPIMLARSDASNLTVNDNSQLNDAIISADGTCDEDDDVPTKEEEETNDLLISGIWEVTLFQDEEDQTSDFAEYLFTFNEDGSLIAEINEVEVIGIWEVSSDEIDDTLEIEFEFDTDEEPLIFLNEEWEVLTRSETAIQMTAEGDDDTERFLTISKI